MNTTILVRATALAFLSSLAMVGERAMALSFATVEAGGGHSCGITPNRQLWCWGANGLGQLGLGYSGGAEPETTPRRVSIEDVTAVSVGYLHTCAIAGGKAWCWGSNDYGLLGLGTSGGAVSFPQPVAGALAGRTDITAISAGRSTSCAVAGGDAYCWGNGGNGEIGNGSYVSTSLPERVWIGEATAIAVGDGHACAIAQDGVWCWGWGAYGALGDGTFQNRAAPVAVVGLPEEGPVERVAAGSQHSCVLAAGKPFCWGSSAFGALGAGGAITSSNIAVPVAWSPQGLAIGLDASGGHTCAIDADGRAWCWGWDVFGQLGDDLALAHKSVPTPVSVPFGFNVTALSAGWGHTCGVAEGTTYCWGSNEGHQLGVIADIEYAQVPIPVNVDRLFDSGFDP